MAGFTLRQTSRSVADSRTLLVQGLEVECLIGVHRHERSSVQRVLVDVELEVEPNRHGDDLRRVVSYEDVVVAVRRLAADGHIQLVETLADRVATCCLGFDGAVSVNVTVLKPDVLPDAAALGVRVRQTR